MTNNKVFTDKQTLIVKGQALPESQIIVRVLASDETIKIFEQIVANSGGSACIQSK